MSLAIKVCGLKDHLQISRLSEMGVAYVGINFYTHSKRYYNEPFSLCVLPTMTAKKVGIFVDAQVEELINWIWFNCMGMKLQAIAKKSKNTFL